MALQPPALGNNNPRRNARARREAGAPVAPDAGAGATPAGATARRGSRGESGAAEPAARSSRTASGTSGAASDGSRAGSAAAGAASGSARDARGSRTTPARRPPRRPRKRWHIVVACLLVVVLLAAGLAVGGFAYLRWFAADDAVDIQGTWYLAGTSTPVTITENRICLTDDVSYPYTLDEGGKTIQFSFSNLAGSGCYRFSLDRQTLALVDGEFSGGDTLGRDIPWMIQAVIAQLQGDVLPPAEAAGKGLTLLSRKPTGSATAPKDAEKESSKDAKKSSAGEGAEKESEKSAKKSSAGEGAEKGSDTASPKDASA